MNNNRVARIFMLLALLCIPVLVYASWESKLYDRGIDVQTDSSNVVISGATGKGLQVGADGTGVSTVFYKTVTIGSGLTSGTVACVGLTSSDYATGAVFLTSNASSAAVLYVKPETDLFDVVVSTAVATTSTVGVTLIQTP